MLVASANASMNGFICEASAFSYSSLHCHLQKLVCLSDLSLTICCMSPPVLGGENTTQYGLVSCFKVLLIFRTNSNISSGVQTFFFNATPENMIREDLSRKPKLQHLRYKFIRHLDENYKGLFCRLHNMNLIYICEFSCWSLHDVFSESADQSRLWLDQSLEESSWQRPREVFQEDRRAWRIKDAKG